MKFSLRGLLVVALAAGFGANGIGLTTNENVDENQVWALFDHVWS